MASDEAWIAAGHKKIPLRENAWYTKEDQKHYNYSSNSDDRIGAITVTREEAEAEQRRIDARMTVTDAMVEAVWQSLKGLEGILIAQSIWSVHKDEFCRRIAQAVLDAPATGTNDSATSLGYLAAQALLEKVETHDQP